MFSHVMLGADDLIAAKTFYDATLGALGVKPGVTDEHGRVVYQAPTGILMLTKPIDGKPASGANGGTIGFLASSPEAADAWHEAGVENGGTACEDPPGPRGDQYYLAYLRDPSGNKLCALYNLR
jgi:catechol 2,3-dioxygenase-like lactoylglutathione lyase family enzyme